MIAAWFDLTLQRLTVALFIAVVVAMALDLPGRSPKVRAVARAVAVVLGALAGELALVLMGSLKAPSGALDLTKHAAQWGILSASLAGLFYLWRRASALQSEAHAATCYSLRQRLFLTHDFTQRFWFRMKGIDAVHKADAHWERFDRACCLRSDLSTREVRAHRNVLHRKRSENSFQCDALEPPPRDSARIGACRASRHLFHRRAVILFLDFDGVLHPHGDCSQAWDLFRSLPLLEALLREFPSVRIVISSSWRTDGLPSLKKHFSDDIAARIVGATAPTRRDADGYAPAEREQEIIAWLQANGGINQAWVALDDADWQFSLHKHRLVACNTDLGLDDAGCAELRAYFERGT